MEINKPKTKSVNIISRKVYLSALEIHSNFGQGLNKHIYRKLLCDKMKQEGLKVLSDCMPSIKHNGVTLHNAFKVDLMLENQMMVFIAESGQNPIHLKTRILNYLKLTGFKLALIIDFNKPLLKYGFKRVVNNLEE